MPGFVDTGLNLVHVDDVAFGHLAALRSGVIGQRYILGGTNVSLADMLANIAELTGRRPPRLRLPRAVIYPIAALAEAAAHLTGREPLATLDGVRMSAHHMFFTAAKAERELGFRARPYREALRDAIQWFRLKAIWTGVAALDASAARPHSHRAKSSYRRTAAMHRSSHNAANSSA